MLARKVYRQCFAQLQHRYHPHTSSTLYRDHDTHTHTNTLNHTLVNHNYNHMHTHTRRLNVQNPIIRNKVTSASSSTSTSPPFVLPPFKAMRPINFVDCAQPSETIVSTLPNGLKVASEDIAGPWCSVSAIVSAGPRTERPPFQGVSHFLDKLAYHSTDAFSQEEVMSKLQRLGGNVSCQTNKETIMYQAMVFVEDLEETMELLGQIVLHGQFSAPEIEEQRQMLQWELETIAENADLFMPELLHRAAYGANTLGNPHLCSQEDADAMTQELIQQFRDKYYISPRMVIAGAGMPHDVLVSLAEKNFGSVSSGPDEPIEPAQYLGGCRLHPMEMSPKNNAKGIPLTQVAVGFESVSWADPDIYPIAVLQLLLGGGLSFSVGGPGKGMFSRMYNNVLNLHHWTEMALAMNLSYMDSGVFYLQGAAPPQRIQQLVNLLLREMMSVAGSVSETEVARARNQLKASLLMNLESKQITCEDIGRQVLGFGFRLSAEELIEKIDAVTPADISRVTRNMLESAPTLAAFGNVDKLAEYDALVELLASAVGSSKAS